jgi:hypothetical protein
MVCLADLVFLIGMALFVGLATSNKIPPDRRSDPILIAIRLVGLFGIVGTIALALAAIRSWRAGTNRVATVKYLCLTLAGVAFSWFAVHWKLMALGLGY